ncbi:hypothetical protein SDC9_107357 [bioreactor metagenome]|uniref:Uncharacterized protein n=1 Tax=bioreactor metagenome TaxID=1076179 RepID=A0A645B628_9ZZZZ
MRSVAAAEPKVADIVRAAASKRSFKALFSVGIVRCFESSTMPATAEKESSREVDSIWYGDAAQMRKTAKSREVKGSPRLRSKSPPFTTIAMSPERTTDTRNPIKMMTAAIKMRVT